MFVFEPAGVGAGLFAFRFERFELVLSDSPLRLLELAPPLVLRFEPPLLLLALTFAPARLAFASRLALFAFPLPLSFLLVFLFRFGLFSFALADEESFAFPFSFALPGLLSLVAVSELSPSFAARLTSTATVWPPFTSSPARGNWKRTVSGFT